MVQWLDARHRTQAHVEDRAGPFKACGAANLPSIDYDRNAAWRQLAALATSLTALLRHLALDGDLAKATTKTLRFRVLSARPATPACRPARLVTHACPPGPPRHPRQTQDLKIPPGWEWAHDLAGAWYRLQALHPA